MDWKCGAEEVEKCGDGYGLGGWSWVEAEGWYWYSCIGREFGWRHGMGREEGEEICIENEPRDGIMGEESFAGIEGVCGGGNMEDGSIHPIYFLL